MNNNKNILVIGPTGNIGQEVLKTFTKKNIAVKAMTKDVTKVKNTETIEWIFGDFTKAETLDKSFHGIEKIIVITPANEDMVFHQTNILEAAKRNQVKHFIKLSSLYNTPKPENTLAKAHDTIEQKIKNSNIAYTFIRPNIFMQTLLGRITEKGVLMSLSGNAKISFTDAQDIGVVLANVALNDKHLNKAYNISGPEALSYKDIATVLSKKLNTKITTKNIPAFLGKFGMKKSGISPWLANAYVELFKEAKHGKCDNIHSQTIKEITGNSAHNFEEFSTNNLNKFIETKTPKPTEDKFKKIEIMLLFIFLMLSAITFIMIYIKKEAL